MPHITVSENSRAPFDTARQQATTPRQAQALLRLGLSPNWFGHGVSGERADVNFQFHFTSAYGYGIQDG